MLVVELPASVWSDDQVKALVADARRRTLANPKVTWPPKLAEMVTDDPADGSTAIDRGHVCLTAW